MASKLADQIASEHSIAKSDLDKNAYRGLTLKNGMKVLLISDPTTDRAAAAVAVQVGTLSEPPEIPGLAHLCEHMLYLGSKKYPQENHFSKFLAEHNGASNAFTQTDQTCYFLGVAPDQLRNALDIFAQFFVEPLFDKLCTEREINVVDSENEHKTKDDAVRLTRIEQVTSSPLHDYARFSRGSRESLCTIPKRKGIDVCKALSDFHAKWYSPNLMNLCVLGRESLNDLANLAIELFGGLTNKKVTEPDWPEHPFTDNDLRIQLNVVPVQDIRKLILTFPVPDVRQHYKTDPSGYVGHLVGHEGEGSLMSYLKRRGWVNSLCNIIRTGARGFGFFDIAMSLTLDGLERIDSITGAVFQYLNLLRCYGPQDWLFRELDNLGSMHFRFRSKIPPIQQVSSLAMIMRDYNWKDLLSGPYMASDFKPDLISDFMSHIIPEKVRIIVLSKTFEGRTDRKEPQYSIDYSLEHIADLKILQWKKPKRNPEFHLPLPNTYIPTNFKLAPEEAKYTKVPILVTDQPHTRVWFMQDHEFRMPKSDALFDLRTPLVYQDPLSFCLTRMAVTCFNDANTEFFYPAELAGSVYVLGVSSDGLSLEVHGYNERQQAMLEKICERLASFKIDPMNFDRRKEQYMRALRDLLSEPPEEQLSYYLLSILSEKFWSHEELLAVVEKDCTAERSEAFLQEILKKLYIEVLVHGNMTMAEARKMGDIVRTYLKSQPLTFAETKNIRIHRLRKGQIYQMNRTNDVFTNNAVMLYCQIGSRYSNDLKLEATMDLFGEIFREPCFNVLRTQEQLGYTVLGGTSVLFGAYGIKIIVESKKNPSFISGRIDAFLNDFMKKCLEEMPPEEFENFKRSLIAILLEKPKSISAKSSHLWTKIISRTYQFDHDELEAKAVGPLTKTDVIDFYKRNIAHDGVDIRHLIINIESKQHPGEMGPPIRPTQVIIDGDKFKKEHDFFEK